MRNDLALVWDFDGTIVGGAATIWPKVEALALCELGITKFGPKLPNRVYKEVDAFSQEGTLKYFSETHGLKATLAEWKKAVRTHLAVVVQEAADAKILPVRKHVLETMRRTNALGMKAAIATMSDLEEVEIILKAIKVSPRELRKLGIADILTPKDLRERGMRGKPAPDIYSLAAERLGVRPISCIAIEDTPRGARAAATAGFGLVIARPEQGESEFRHLRGFRWQDLQGHPKLFCKICTGPSASQRPIVILPRNSNPWEIIEAWSQFTNFRTFAALQETL
jgi:beta-phosphoglucomutase-like phosphatase (HAD superfamily)